MGRRRKRNEKKGKNPTPTQPSPGSEITTPEDRVGEPGMGVFVSEDAPAVAFYLRRFLFSTRRREGSRRRETFRMRPLTKGNEARNAALWRETEPRQLEEVGARAVEQSWLRECNIRGSAAALLQAWARLRWARRTRERELFQASLYDPEESSGLALLPEQYCATGRCFRPSWLYASEITPIEAWCPQCCCCAFGLPWAHLPALRLPHPPCAPSGWLMGPG